MNVECDGNIVSIFCLNSNIVSVVVEFDGWSQFKWEEFLRSLPM